MKEELLTYIETLTPAQIEKIVNLLPKVREVTLTQTEFSLQEALERIL